jgi:hypothetical protein
MSEHFPSVKLQKGTSDLPDEPCSLLQVGHGNPDFLSDEPTR